MGQVAVTIHDPADIREFDCLLPEDAWVSAVARRLAELVHLPLSGPDGLTLDYGLVVVGGPALDPQATLSDLDLAQPIRARLVPEVVVGSETGGLFDPAELAAAELFSPDTVVVREERALVHDEGLDLRLDVRIDGAVHREMERIASVDPHIECAGLLLGEVVFEGKRRVVHVTAAVPAKDAQGSRTSVKLTLAAWEGLLRERDTAHPDLRTLGWFHTHAGWGVFLSESDLFVHRCFFPHPNMVAHVLDSTTGRDGFFHWEDGGIVPCGSYALVGGAERSTPAPKPRKRRRNRRRSRRLALVGAALAIVVCAGVAGPKLLGERPAPHPVSRVAHHAPSVTKPAAQIKVYRLGRRDNLWLICRREYGDSRLADALARYNGISDVNGLQLGQEIKLPSKDALVRFAETEPLPVGR